ncbi:biotin--[acetyl-CoA-carboxylase] ligase [Exiguobacterium himgiriensis]|uniref:biotin--[acetyl-CoA-carboxylase] ligase n=1 Tax=Exiguobacterium himgiriensis TaxID=384621 RepID=UPI0021AED0DB|nr:biotin--[acetyl-CoA-carboxylase] ligase [Exiguobacterium himgiriensis]MCT4781778.1 biotin--[acetyl-CoA-carboxylase] ligase [Exiguobacterium himgiriensis]
MASTRGRVLSLLQDGAVWSGQELARQLNISRTAIWKHIETLKQDGYAIETIPRKGYQLLEQNDRFDETAFVSVRRGRFGQHVHAYDQVDTTQRIAHELAQRGAMEGTIVISEEQTAGRGQLGRNWYNPSRVNIAASIILRPELPIRDASKLTLMAASAFARSLQREGIDATIKWPNDLLLNGKKIGGILTEMQTEGDRIQAVILGFGFNVNGDTIPEELLHRATSLKRETGVIHRRSELLARLLEDLESEYELFLETGFRPIQEHWLQNAAYLNETISLKTAGKTKTGVMRGISPEGALLLETEAGVEPIYSAEIAVWND